MDKKLAQHLQMVTQYGLYKLTKEQASGALKEVDFYEHVKGYDIENYDDPDVWEREVTAFHDTDGEWRRLWHRWNELFDESMQLLDNFGAAVEHFTDGRISKFDAKQMAISPKTEERLERVMLSGMEA